MKSLFMSICVAIIAQSCCVYHSQQTIGDKKIREMGIAPYSSRPIKQSEEALK